MVEGLYVGGIGRCGWEVCWWWRYGGEGEVLERVEVRVEVRGEVRVEVRVEEIGRASCRERV